MTMANPQWKAPVQDPAILAFQRSSNMANFVPNSGTSLSGSSSNNMNNSVRETGFIEKVLHSYGFIQCCDRDARLFFHFSEYNGNVDHIKPGDPVEFQMSYDRRTGKPIAVQIMKLEDGAISFEVLSENTVTGTVAAEAKPPRGPGSIVQDGMGRVSYEQSGEHFFMPFALEDVEENAALRCGDQVTFYIATDKRNGDVRARKVTLVEAAKIEIYQGVVCSMKDSYGFIERSDVVKEIFFHYSEYTGDINELVLGDDVEFAIQIRNGKEVAANIKHLPEGTVVFEDVGLERRRGKIQKTLKTAHGRRQSDPLAGKIIYETLKGQSSSLSSSPIEIPYGDKDQRGDYTLQSGDIVEFNIATDRRDKLQRATSITLVEDTFKVNGEKRETGIIATIKDGFGFIRCAEREVRMFFHFSEMMDPSKDIKVQDEVEFTIIQDPTAPSRQIGIRIKHLPRGTVTFDNVLPEKIYGNIEKELATHKSPGKNREPDPGIIMYDVNGTKQTIPYSIKAIQSAIHPKYGDKVEFQICESRKNNTRTATNIKVLINRNSGSRCYGFIATLKDNFGFIEMDDHNKEVFFHFSAFEGDANDLDLGDEVEFNLSRKTAKVSAENIRKLPRGTVAPEDHLPGLIDGRIIRCMRIINPDQDEYPGIVQVGTEEDPSAEVYPYGITGLADKRDFLQKGDIVKFQLAIVRTTGQKRATSIAAVRKYVRAKVDSVKGQFGFLSHEVEDGKKLFFHMTEVHDGAELQPGDEVEFVVVQNQRNGKYSACSLRKITERQRPDRLISRLKSVGEECGPKVLIIRQPRGPDGTRGFTQERTPWQPPK